VATKVVNERGDAVYKQEGVVDPRQRPQFGVDAGATITLEGFEPGLYRLGLEARVGDSKAASAMRKVAFVVTGPP
jgi:hypothetical protein